MIRSMWLAGVISASALGLGCAAFGADPAPLVEIPDTTPPGKPHFDSRGAKAGDQLPNLPMTDLDGKPSSLATAWSGGPTLLLTSSYTCPKSRSTYPQAAELARRIVRRGIHVVIVYIIEAHPAGDPSPYSGNEEVTSENRRDHILCRQPRTLAERLKLANEFSRQFKGEIPVLVDAMDNAAWESLGGGPNMGVLVDAEGIVIARQGWFDAPSMQAAIGALAASLPRRTVVAEPGAVERNRHYIVYQLIASNKVQELKALLDQQPELQQQIMLGENVLQMAAAAGALEVVRLLVERGASVNGQTAEEPAPLHRAARRGHLDVVRFLIDHGADVDAKAHGHGPTPLQMALLEGKKEVADALIKAGARPNFYTAAATGDLAELRRYFLQDASFLSRPDGSGNSPLVYAAATGHLDSLKLLISLGARDYPNRPYGGQAIWWALRRQNLEMTHLLLNAGSDPNQFNSAINDDIAVDFVRALLEHKADPNAGDGLPPLLAAAGYNRLDIMQVLLDAGADINATSKISNGLFCGLTYFKGDSALHIALQNNKPLAVEFLLTAGAKVDVRNAQGETPLLLAIAETKYNWETAERTVRLLVEHHADVNIRDKEGRTALDYAMVPSRDDLFEVDPREKASDVRTIEFLKKHGAIKGHPADTQASK